MAKEPKVFLALDIGTKRIGVAIANDIARLPSPLMTIAVGDNVISDITKLVEDQRPVALISGLPRDISGKETSQTILTKDFIDKLRQVLSIPIYLVDEAATSIKAEDELRARGGSFKKEDIDALAATYILEDYFNNES